MANYSGVVLSTYIARSSGIVAPRFARPTAGVAQFGGLSDALVVNNYAYVNEGGAPVGTSSYAGNVYESSTPGFDWFNKIHILPRATIDFGNIVTTQTSAFEIFNAYRTAASLTAFTSGAGAGVTVPELPALPSSIPPLYSLLDTNSSTRLNPVKLIIRADTEGAPQFDGNLTFFFSGANSVYVRVKGSRIAFLFAEWSESPTEYLEFGTDILPTVAGGEQRISYRKSPRQRFEVSLLLDGDDRRRFQLMIFDWYNNNWAVPLWYDRLYLTAAISAGATTVTVASTSNVDFRVGGLAVIYKSATVYDVLVIQTITSTQITFTSAAQNSYSVNDLLMPIRLCVIDTTDTAGGRYPVTLEEFKLSFTCVENETGAPAGSTTGWNTYNSKVLLDDPNVMFSNPMKQTFQMPLIVLDNGAGNRYQTANLATSKRGFAVGFSPKTRADFWKMRMLFYALRGRQKSFYAPTRIADLTVTGTLTNGSNQMQIQNIGYFRFGKQQQPKATFKITFTDGTSLVRTITASAEVDANNETLTLDSTWTSTKLATEVSEVQFYELVRLDSDEIQIEHGFLGRATVEVPVKVVQA